MKLEGNFCQIGKTNIHVDLLHTIKYQRRGVFQGNRNVAPKRLALLNIDPSATAYLEILTILQQLFFQDIFGQLPSSNCTVKYKDRVIKRKDKSKLEETNETMEYYKFSGKE